MGSGRAGPGMFEREGRKRAGGKSQQFVVVHAGHASSLRFPPFHNHPRSLTAWDQDDQPEGETSKVRVEAMGTFLL